MFYQDLIMYIENKKWLIKKLFRNGENWTIN